MQTFAGFARADFAAMDLTPFVVALVFIGLDVVLGMASGAAKGQFKSSAMRRGLWHKAGSIAVMLFGYAVQIAVQMVDFSQLGVDISLSVPLGAVCAAYIVLMEAASILENVLGINPELKNVPIFRIFKNLPVKQPGDTPGK